MLMYSYGLFALITQIYKKKMGLDRKNKNYELEFIDVFVFHKRKISSPLKNIFSVIKRMTSEPSQIIDKGFGFL